MKDPDSLRIATMEEDPSHTGPTVMRRDLIATTMDLRMLGLEMATIPTEPAIPEQHLNRISTTPQECIRSLEISNHMRR